MEFAENFPLENRFLYWRPSFQYNLYKIDFYSVVFMYLSQYLCLLKLLHIPFLINGFQTDNICEIV